MLNDFTGADQVYIACGYTDLRKGIDGLARLVQQQFELDPFTNTLFLFCGRRRDRIKGLYWEKDGFILLYKRLEQAQVITSLTLQNEWLLEQLKLSKKKLFGRSSEQAEQMVMEQLSLTYNELEAYAFGTKAATEKQITVKAHERKRQSGNVLDVVPEGTPTEVVEHRLPEDERICRACGSEMVEIGKEVRRTLQMKPAEFWVREDIYYTYACKNCEQETGEANIVKAVKEPSLLPGSFASAEAVAYLATQKFVMYSPLYRLQQEFERQGLKLSRQTMANWLLNISEKWLRPVYDTLREQLCKEPVLHADDDLAGVERAGTFLHQQVLHVAVPHQRLRETGGCAV